MAMGEGPAAEEKSRVAGWVVAAIGGNGRERREGAPLVARNGADGWWSVGGGAWVVMVFGSCCSVPQ
jgi:hypothetical protein